MALYPAAEKRLLHPGLNHSVGGMGTIHGVIVHVIVGSLAAADSVFHNPSRSASAHFGVGKDGHVVQWVDTSDKAWAEGAGNSQWISVETEGYPNEALTNAQLTAVGAIVRWAHDLYHFPLQVTDSTTGYGVGTHSMGGAAWGGHACPGSVRAAQRTNIVNIAAGVPAPAPQPGPVPGPAPTKDRAVYVTYSPEDATNARWLTDDLTRRWIQTQVELTFYVNKYGAEKPTPISVLANVPTVGKTP